MINLNQCVPGQKLKSKHGMILTYVGRNNNWVDYPHDIKYPNGAPGTRTDEGYVAKINPLPEDEDIIEILPL